MGFQNIRFTIQPEVLDLGLRGVYLAMGGLQNRPSDPEFDHLVESEIATLSKGLTRETIASDPILAGFRKLHDAAKVPNRKNLSAAENLLEFVLARGRLPRINLLVDIYNLVSVKTRLALGAHDIARITGDVALRFTDGTERFVPLGADAPKPVKAGEYSYVDASNEILCRLEVRQVEKTKVGLDTTECLYIVQGNRATDDAYIRRAAEELLALTKRFCGGTERFLA